MKEVGQTMSKRAILIFSLLLLGFLPYHVDAGNNQVNIYFFWGENCPHCTEEKEFLRTLQKKYRRLSVKSYEVWHDKDNAKLFADMLKMRNLINTNVPATFLSDVVWHGYDGYIRKEIEDMVRYCLDNDCPDPMASHLPRPKESEDDNRIDLPILGRVDAARISLPVLTAVLGLVDGFNPCAFFILFILLGMLIHAGSRRRMLLIGGTFVFCSGLVYFLFMSAWLNLFLVLGRVGVITSIAGAVALTIAAINIKDFFFFKRGVSLTIPDNARPKLYERMRSLLRATSLAPMIIGTVVLAVMANTFELLCTAGFPMVFTRVLTLHSLATSQYYLYLGLYSLIYIIPLLSIVVLLATTLGARKLTSRQGQVLKLISGLMMLCLGLAILIEPALLNNLALTAGMIAMSLALAGLLSFAAKRLRGERLNKRGSERMA